MAVLLHTHPFRFSLPPPPPFQSRKPLEFKALDGNKHIDVTKVTRRGRPVANDVCYRESRNCNFFDRNECAHMVPLRRLRVMLSG